MTSYIESEFAKLNSKSKLTIENLHGGKPWVTDHTHWNFEAAKRATKARFLLFCSSLSWLMGINFVGGVWPRPRSDKGGRVDPCYADVCGIAWCECVVVAYGEGG